MDTGADYEPQAWTDDVFGVVVEDHFDFAEYEAYVLSADDDNALLGWLDANGFVLAEGVSALLEDYLDGTFLAVRVEAGQVAPGEWLSPIQVDYRSPMISLPIRLGALSSTGVQDLTLYTLSTEGRGAIVNYPQAVIRSSCMRTGDQGLSSWYENAFATTTGLALDPTSEQRGASWVLEYGWRTPKGRRSAKCDPCVGNTSGFSMTNPSDQPLTAEDVAVLGLPEGLEEGFYTTRMHMRYTPDAVPQDLSVVTDTQIFDNVQLLWVQHAHELESLVETCGGAPEEPGSCYSSEYFLNRAQERASGRAVDALVQPSYCGSGGRSALWLALPLTLIGLRRRS